MSLTCQIICSAISAALFTIKKNGEIERPVSEVRQHEWFFYTTARSLPFTDVQKIMNYYRHGEKHSLPRDTLSFYPDYSSGSGFNIRECGELRVSKGELVLHQSIKLEYLLSKISFPADNRPFCLCPHLRCSELFEKTPLETMALLECQVCPTEIRAYHDLSKGGKHKLKISIWRVLGPCRNPHEPQWRMATERHGQILSPISIRKVPAPVRQRFDESRRCRIAHSHRR